MSSIGSIPELSTAPVLCLVVMSLLLPVASLPCVSQPNTKEPDQVNNFVCKDIASVSQPQYFSHVFNGYNVTFPTTHMFCGEIVDKGTAAVGYRARSLAAPKNNRAGSPASFHEHKYGYPAYKDICIWDQNRKRCATKVLGDTYYNATQRDPSTSPPFQSYYSMFPVDWDVNNTVEVISRHASACCQQRAVYYEGFSRNCEGLLNLCIINFTEYKYRQSTPFTIMVVFTSPVTKKAMSIETAFPAPNGIDSCAGWYNCNAALLYV